MSGHERVTVEVRVWMEVRGLGWRGGWERRGQGEGRAGRVEVFVGCQSVRRISDSQTSQGMACINHFSYTSRSRTGC